MCGLIYVFRRRGGRKLTGAKNGAGTAADAKALSIVGGMLAGANGIDDLDVLRHGGGAARPRRRLGMSQSALPWAVTAFALPSGGFLLLFGRIGDLYGRRRLFLTGPALYGAASLFATFAWDPASFLAGRALQGIGAAAIVPTGMSLLPRRSRRDRPATALSVSRARCSRSASPWAWWPAVS